MLAQIKAHVWQIAALSLGSLLLWQTLQRHAAELRAADAVATLATERDAAGRAALAQTEKFRNLEGNHGNEITQIMAGASAAIAAAGADAERDRADRLRMQRDVADYITAHRAAAQARAATGQCAPDFAPLDLLAELRRRADDRAGELAAVADQARARGTACERAYDSGHAMSEAARKEAP